MRLVVSQPMFIPWIGYFEQLALADCLVHYDDVQMPQGRSFMSRVQLKTASGQCWMTAPVDRRKSSRTINETWYQASRDWKQEHLDLLVQHYRKATCFRDMMVIAEKIYGVDELNLASFNQRAIAIVADCLRINVDIRQSSDLGIPGKGSMRLLEICRKLGADTYITGHGASNYLDHELFDNYDVGVSYIDYLKLPYDQLHGPFNPYVSVLDVIANLGEESHGVMKSNTVDWRKFIHGSK